MTHARKLDAYRAKRDFTKTAEPRGSRAAAPGSPQLRFVVQKHAARRLHYDLRLELDGVFKSWAVTRGPSLDPADKRLAVEVEDHPLEYGDFEGTIPKGEYGGGTVQLWDRGYWLPDAGESPRQALEAGELRFTLLGERLKGRFVLVRIRNPRGAGRAAGRESDRAAGREAGRRNWLLIKRRDEAAEEVGTAAESAGGVGRRRADRASQRQPPLLDEDRSVASGRTMEMIAAGKGPAPRPFMTRGRVIARADAVWHSNRSGASGGGNGPATARSQPRTARESTRRARGAARDKRTAAVAGPIPGFVPPQLCRLVDRPPGGGGWAHEIKFDGYRLQLRVSSGSARLKTRKGLDWTDKFATIAAEARELPDCLIDGEAVALDRHGVPSFAALQAALAAHDTRNVVFFAFDLLYGGGRDLRRLPLEERKKRLQALLAPRANAEHVRYVDHFESGADALLKSACRMQLEGIVSKRLDAPYTSGRGDAWTKAKCRGGQEVVIGAWTGERGACRSLLAGVFSEGRLIYVGRIGTGYGAEVVRALLKRLVPLASDVNPFSGAPPPTRKSDVHWVRPELVAEIEFSGWTGSGMIRQAAFKGLREDKPAREVTTELPAEPTAERSPEEPLARAAGRRVAHHARRHVARRAESSAEDSPLVLGVRISNPDKPLWPHANDGRPVTKLELAQYYASVGSWMIGHLTGRPCSLVRAPDGIGGQHFFQRHAMPGTSSLLETTKVSGDRKPYLRIDRVEGLVAAAQIAAVELHPWNSQPGTPDRPGRLVLDIDPAPDVSFDRVVAAALELRERLESLGLECFCKTTGGKGLHVVTPLAGGERIDWPTAKTFAQTVCAQMAADSPDRYLVTMSKKARAGRIYLDYLRNDRFATAVAPLSPRAREGAPVSMPLQWSQVRAGLAPARFTLRTAPGLLAKTRPWSGYDEAARPLGRAIERLTGAAARSARTPPSRASDPRASRPRSAGAAASNGRPSVGR